MAVPRSSTSPITPDHGSSTLGDDLSVRRAYHAHGAELYRFALRQLHDPGAAEDVVQETFVRAWRNAHRFDPEVADLRVWLFAIARNVVIDHTRRDAARPWQQPVETPQEQTGDPWSAPSSFEDDLMQGWLVTEALHRIAADHRTALVEVHLRGRPQAEVAAELNIPIGTLRSRVFYGLKSLRMAMEEMGVEP